MDLPVNQVLEGDCRDVLAALPPKSVDLIFADPPYNLQLEGELWRPNMTRVQAVEDDWDRFQDFAAYDTFTEEWLRACRRVLKDTGTLWVIGTYHNIYRVGKTLMDLGYWLLNDISWIKSNPMPQFRGVRFTNAHETLLWAKKHRAQKQYTFNYHALKMLNDDKQMRSDWELPICTGAERLKRDGRKAHPTQKPEALLYRVLLATTAPGAVVLDPFLGTGTTAVVARKLRRHWIGVEQDPEYAQLARERIAATPLPLFEDDEIYQMPSRRTAPRVPFGALVEAGLIQPGQRLWFDRRPDLAATVAADGALITAGGRGSIHSIGAALAGQPSCNGWDHWFYRDSATGQLLVIDALREQVRHQGLAELINAD
jgi:modification methylase